MWGNKIGWGLSVVVVVLFGALLYLIKHAGDATSPTEAFKANLEANLAVITLPVEPETVVAMDQDQDAAPLYRAAMEVYNKHNHDFEDFVDTKNPKKKEHMHPDRLAAVIASFDENLIPATHDRTAILFEKKPEEVINYDVYKYPIMDLYWTGKACNLNGLFVAQTDAKKALQYYEAAFALGAHMYHERMTYEEFRAGMLLMGESSVMLGRAKDLDKNLADVAQSFYDQSYTPWTQGAALSAATYEYLYTFNPDTLSDRIGDIFALALKSKEHLWRTEALLTLGRCQYNIGGEHHGGDQRTAKILFQKWGDDPDLAIRAAARAARDLTLDQFRWIRPRTLPQ